jgi:iron complex transport system ATP-binding protein
MIELKNIVIGRGKALFRVENLTLQPGKLYALIGANGSGKSTFLQTLNTQIKPYSGEIFLNNKNLNLYSVSELSHSIAFVNSDFKGLSGLTILQYVLLGRTPYLGFYGNHSQKDIEICLKAIEDVGISAIKDQYTDKISDGQRQLASIARAIAQETPFIILDEPTTFLDNRNKKIVIDIIQKLSSEGKMIVFSTHDLNAVTDRKLPILLITNKNELQVFADSLSYNDLTENHF